MRMEIIIRVLVMIIDQMWYLERPWTVYGQGLDRVAKALKSASILGFKNFWTGRTGISLIYLYIKKFRRWATTGRSPGVE